MRVKRGPIKEKYKLGKINIKGKGGEKKARGNIGWYLCTWREY